MTFSEQTLCVKFNRAVNCEIQYEFNSNIADILLLIINLYLFPKYEYLPLLKLLQPIEIKPKNSMTIISSQQQILPDRVKGVKIMRINTKQSNCDMMIFLIQKEIQNLEWIVIQKITVEKYGYRVCFIGNNMFIFSPYATEQISIFEMNNINKQFTKTRDITVKCGPNEQRLFPQQYVQSECILLSKNDEYVNLIRKNKMESFQLNNLFNSKLHIYLEE
ncbi:unnamed protein product [Paramecium sonneborni]|uniref:Uncharacterized protein n=1 Tax=Paramecium sonneborni TaxID=65129 RepID=A0A8S1RTW4_9CILI|nr:unnamed protein product [Paramecium sonneborni]